RPGYLRGGRPLPSRGRRGLRAPVGPGRADVGRAPGAWRGLMTLWERRLGGSPADALMAFTASIEFDRRLAADDIAGSRAHVRGLGRAGILSTEEGSIVLVALNRLAEELASDTSKF